MALAHVPVTQPPLMHPCTLSGVLVVQDVDILVLDNHVSRGRTHRVTVSGERDVF